MWSPSQFVSMFVHGPTLDILINSHRLIYRTVTLEKKQAGGKKTLKWLKSKNGFQVNRVLQEKHVDILVI